MGNLKQKYSVGFLFSLAVHLALVVLLFTSLHSKVTPSHFAEASGDIIQATMVDEKPLKPMQKEVMPKEKEIEHKEVLKKPEPIEKNDKELKMEPLKQEKLEKQEKIQEKPEQTAITDTAQIEANKALKLKQELQKTKEEEQAHLAQLRLEKEKERKELEALKKEKEKEKKRLAALDEKRQEEQDRANQLRIERETEEKKKKELLEAKHKLEEEKKLAASKAKEQARLAAIQAERQKVAQGEFRKYESIIKDKVKGCWIRPSGLPAKLQCKLEISAMPDGDVINVKVVKSSGNEAFDQSAIAAVQKAVPLPFPQGEPDVMNLFRHFTFEFIPDENSEVYNHDV